LADGVVERGNVQGEYVQGNVRIPLHVPAGSRLSRRHGWYSVHYDDFQSINPSSELTTAPNSQSSEAPTYNVMYIVSEKTIQW